DYKTNRSNNADTLQLIVYEKMLREKYEDAGNIASQFDYIFQEKTNKLSDVKSDKKIENVKSFLTAFKEFSHNWDNVEFLGDKSPCKYCRFQSLCKIREGEKMIEQIQEMKAELALREDLKLLTGKNIFIRAGAGAGKSTLMVDRLTSQAMAGNQPF